MKNMVKISLFLSFFSIFSCSSYAQVKHEFKVNMMDFLSFQLSPMYEQVRGEGKWGIEFGLPLDARTKKIIPLTVGVNEYSSFFIRPNIAFKRYIFFNEQGGQGLYIGPYMEMGISTYVEEGYVERMELLNGGPILEYYATPVGIKNIHAGLNIGYKFLYREKYVIEPTLLSTVGVKIGNGAAVLGYLLQRRINFTFRIGLRF